MKEIKRTRNTVTYGGMIDPKIVGDTETEWMDEYQLQKWRDDYEKYRKDKDPFYTEITMTICPELDEPQQIVALNTFKWMVFDFSK